MTSFRAWSKRVDQLKWRYGKSCANCHTRLPRPKSRFGCVSCLSATLCHNCWWSGEFPLCDSCKVLEVIAGPGDRLAWLDNAYNIARPDDS